MPTRVDFYLLQHASTPAAELFLCRLIEKIYQQDQSIYIAAASPQQLTRVDSLLWTFHDAAFIPHALQSAADPSTAIILDYAQTPQRTYDVLINLAVDVPGFALDFPRVIELVLQQDVIQRDAARARYRHYQTQGCELHTHTIDH